MFSVCPWESLQPGWYFLNKHKKAKNILTTSVNTSPREGMLMNDVSKVLSSLAKGYRIKRLAIFISFETTTFLKLTLRRILTDLETINPRGIKLDIKWKKENLLSSNRKVIKNFLLSLKDDMGRRFFLPLCLPGYPNYKKIKKFFTFPECKKCIFRKSQSCGGLFQKRDLALSEMLVKDFEDIELTDFLFKEVPLTGWIPRREDIEKIILFAECLHQGNSLPTVLDFGCGQGFLPYLLAQTNRLKVVGIDPNKDLIKKTRFKHKNLTLLTGDINLPNKRWRNRFDLVLSSMMPDELDFTPCLKRMLNPKAVVYIKDYKRRKDYHLNLEVNEKSNKFIYSIDQNIGYNPQDNYKSISQWKVIAIDDFSKDKGLNKNLSGQIEIQMRKDIKRNLLLKAKYKEKYKWEKELEKT